jgi:hypothetical protein
MRSGSSGFITWPTHIFTKWPYYTDYLHITLCRYADKKSAVIGSIPSRRSTACTSRRRLVRQ